MATHSVSNDLRPSAPAPVRIPGQPSRLVKAEPLVIGGASVVAFLIIWQAIAAANLVNTVYLPGPSDIFNALREQIDGGNLWRNMRVSGQELAIGYLLAVVVGLPTGMVMGWYRRLRNAINPFLIFFYATPRIALVPLFIIWFGIGMQSKIAVIFLGAVFPIIINTIAGVRNLDGTLIKAARSFGASDAQLFRTVALPGSVPYILTGLRLAVGHALIGVVVGEFVAAQEGIGKMMADASSMFQTPTVFAGLFIVACAGLILNAILERIERRFQAWRPNHDRK